MPLDSEFYDPAEDATIVAILDRAIEHATLLTDPATPSGLRCDSGDGMAYLISTNADRIREATTLDHAPLAETVIGIADALREGRNTVGGIIAEIGDFTITMNSTYELTAHAARGVAPTLSGALENWMKDGLQKLQSAAVRYAASDEALLAQCTDAERASRDDLTRTADRLAGMIIEENITLAALLDIAGENAVRSRVGSYKLTIHGLAGVGSTLTSAVEKWLFSAREAVAT